MKALSSLTEEQPQAEARKSAVEPWLITECPPALRVSMEVGGGVPQEFFYLRNQAHVLLY